MADHRRSRVRSELWAVLPGLAMLLVLAAGVVLSAVNPSAWRSPGRLSLLDGSWVSRYEERFEESLPLRAPAAGLWDLIRYTVFGEGAPGVLVGRNGWLFTAEEFRAPDRAADGEYHRLEEQLDLVSRVRRSLEARGVALTVVLVPAKARVYPEHLGRHVPPEGARKRYAAVLQGLSARGIAVADLLEPLKDARRAGEVFLRTDTHWTPHGAQRAAQAVSALVIPELERAGSPRTAFRIAREQETEHRGDLLNFIRLGPWLERFGPPPDRITPNRAAAGEAAETGLFDELAIPVVMTGTSYSAGPLWGFEHALKTALRADVLNAAEDGLGPFQPMQSLLDSPVLEDVGARVVVWEIPERYFLFPP
ncbi:MAG: hypothetical protein JXB06_01260 [Spirochaetales bacterium]|nr:hypothetical protein [Spirochaetales bacterium]